MICRVRHSLGSSEWALLVAVAHVELVVVSSPRRQVAGLYLDGVINVTGSVSSATALNFLEVCIFGNLPLDTDGSSRNLLGTVAEKRRIAGHCGIAGDIYAYWSNACPQNDGIWVGISRGHAVGEVQLIRREFLVETWYVYQSMSVGVGGRDTHVFLL
jgi:hypothetical protein